MTRESFIWEKLFMKGEAPAETIILKTSLQNIGELQPRNCRSSNPSYPSTDKELCVTCLKHIINLLSGTCDSCS